MTRCVIYTRYSSDKQSENSLEDQARECRLYAEQRGWEVVGVYGDAAISGTSDKRPSYQDMFAKASQNEFDVVLSEAIDRLSRNLSDAAKLHDELSFNGVKLFVLNIGEVAKMHIAFMGLGAEMYVSDLSEKVDRGQKGLIHNGKTAGGLAYGYSIGQPGERSVIEEEANIVRRIFEEYSKGVSPREIAKRLNEEGVPGPSGKDWKDTTIRGQRARGTGLLNNEAYIGRLIYGRTSYRKDPRTGKKVAKVKPQSEWLIEEVPDLRIVSDELWAAVEDQKERNTIEMPRDNCGAPLNRLHRKKHVLSGILKCGCCGGNMAITGADRYGCSTYRASRTYKNSRSIPRKDIERRVLGGLQQRLMQPEMVEEYLRVVEQEMRDAAKQQGKQRRRPEKRIQEMERRMDRMLDAIADGHAPASAMSKVSAWESEKEELEASLVEFPEDPDVIPIHNISDMYAKRVQQLVNGLSDPVLKQQAIGLIQSMIEYVTVTPEDDGFTVDLHGELGRILEIVTAGEAEAGAEFSQHSHTVVAGVGFEPTTFRL